MLSASIPNDVRKAVYRRDNFRCALCDSNRGIQVHHIIHRSEGGRNFRHNLITLCWKCHAAAHGTKIPEYPEYIDEEYMDQACIEYMADYYAQQGFFWDPYQEQMQSIIGNLKRRGGGG